jgi:hypothetical protein
MPKKNPDKAIIAEAEAFVAPTRRRKRKRTADFHFKRLKDLPNFQTIRLKLASGISCESVAEWMQVNVGQCTDVKRDTLVRQLYRFRESIPPAEIAPVQLVKMHQKVEQFTHQLSAHDELVKIIEYQLVRLGKLVEMEEKMAMGVLPTMGTEMDRMVKYLSNLAVLRGEMGLIKPGMGEMMPGGSSAGEFAGEMLAGVISTLTKRHGEDAHARLATIGKRIQQGVAKAMSDEVRTGHLTMLVGPDGALPAPSTPQIADGTAAIKSLDTEPLP